MLFYGLNIGSLSVSGIVSLKLIQNIFDSTETNIPGVFATVDFGSGANVTKAFEVQRLFEPQGPLVNSEFYSGWLDYWGEKHSKADANQTAKALDTILATGANVNIYMFHGGTSFAFGKQTSAILQLFSATEPTQ